MSEHFTRNTESISCWCFQCNELTDHPVSDGHIGRCPNPHGPQETAAQEIRHRKSQTPQLNIDESDPDVIELGPAGLANHQHRISMEDRIFLLALDGWPQTMEHRPSKGK
jgi:hypothetical protein